jgi:hypothetical protein
MKSFLVAMANDLGRAPYEMPNKIVERGQEWLIVSRFGPDGEYLSISEAGAIAGGAAEVPAGIRPVNSILGILANCDEGTQTAEFLLTRNLPDGITVAGTFFPAEGFARLTKDTETVRLHACGRHAHSRGSAEGREVLRDVPNPAPGTRSGQAWQFDARRVPWSAEKLPCRSN